MKFVISVAFAIWAASSFALPQTGSFSASAPESTGDSVPAYVTAGLHLNNEQNFTSSTFNSVENITNNGDLVNAIDKSNPVIIAAVASWCGPCKVVNPYYDRWSDVYKPMLFYRFDVDYVQNAAAELGVTAMPTYMIFSERKKLAQLVGADLGGLESMIRTYYQKGVNGSVTASVTASATA